MLKRRELLFFGVLIICSYFLLSCFKQQENSYFSQQTTTEEESTTVSSIEKVTVKFMVEGIEVQTDVVYQNISVFYKGNNTKLIKKSDNYYDYEFSGWDITGDGESDILQNGTFIAMEDTIVNAVFLKNLKYYNIRFFNEDNTILYETKAPYESLIEYKGEVPTKTMNYSTVYTFSGWDKELKVTGNMDFFATYNSETRKYLQNFYYDDTLLASYDVLADDYVDYLGIKPANWQDKEYMYTFSGWKKQNGGKVSLPYMVNGQNNFIADFSKTPIYYTVNFYDSNNQIIKSFFKRYKEAIPNNLIPQPSKEATNEKVFRFSHWDKDFSNIIEDLNIYPIFNEYEREHRYIYQLINNQALITGSHFEEEIEYSIPSRIEGYPVLGIADNAFKNFVNIEVVKFAEGITTIGKNAFFKCLKLKEISIRSVGDNAFSQCSLSNLRIPKNLQYIGNGAFTRPVTFYRGTLSIDSENRYFTMINGCLLSDDGKVLYLCPFLSSNPVYMLPDSITTILPYACCGVQIGNKVFNNSLRSLRSYAFYRATANSLIFSGLEEISDYAFSNSRISSVEFNEGIERFGSNCFEESTISFIRLPESTLSISKYMFYNCRNLSEIEIPDKVSNILEHAFDGCKSLTTIVFSSNSELKTIESYAIANTIKLTRLDLPKSLIHLGEYGIYNNAGLTEVLCYTEMTYLESYAIYLNKALQVITLPKDLNKIGKYALAKNDITSLAIPEKVEYIADFAFSDNKMIEIVIPASVVYIGPGCFLNVPLQSADFAVQMNWKYDAYVSKLSLGEIVDENGKVLYYHSCYGLNNVSFTNKQNSALHLTINYVQYGFVYKNITFYDYDPQTFITIVKK